MANEKDIKINLTADTKNAETSIKKLNNDIDDTKKKANESTGVFKKIGTTGSNAFKGIGTAIKGAGIGILIGLVAALFEVFKKNQAVIDTFNTVMNAIGAVVNQFIGTFSELFKKVNESTGGFDALKNVMINLLNLSIKPLQIGFEAIKLAVLSAQLAWEDSFFGGKDQDKIDSLKESINETKDNIKELGESALDSLVEVGTNFGEAIGEVAQLGNAVVEATSETMTKITDGTITEIARQATAAENSLKRLEQEQQRIQLTAQRNAEVQRQIRDDETRSIDERIEANKKLGDILKQQGEDELSNIDQRIAAVEQRKKVEGDNIEIQQELQDLQNQRLEVEERITGQQSEQLTNQNSLNKEKLEQEQNFQAELEELKAEAYLTSIENKEEREAEQLEIDAEKAEEELENRLEQGELNEAQYEELLQATRDRYAAIRLEKKREQDAALVESEKNAKDQRLNAQAQLISGLQSLFGEETAIGKAAMIAGQAQAIAQIVQNTGIANAKATAALPLTGGMPFTAINTIAAGVNIAGIIAKTAQNLGAFEDGGVVGGNSRSGDNILARVNSEEVILNSGQQANLLFQLANQSSLGGSESLSEERVAQIAAQVVDATPVYVVESAISDKQKQVSVREQGFSVK